MKERAMKDRYVKTMESLAQPSRLLPVLNVGDNVFIQNQRGRFSNKWDRSGVVMEVKPNDQFVIKVAGTGRLTLRNRRFLRKYTLHRQSSESNVNSGVVFKDQPTSDIPKAKNSLQEPSMTSIQQPDETVSCDDGESPSLMIADKQDCPVTAPEFDCDSTPYGCSDNRKRVYKGGAGIITRLASYNKPGQLERLETSDASQNVVPEVATELRRSTRAMAKRKVFDASIGKWKDIN